MKIEFDFSSFRFRIITTLVIVVTLTTFGAFYIYNKILGEKIFTSAREDMISFLYFMRDQVISIHDGRLIKPYLQTLEGNNLGLHSHLVSADGKVVYPAGKKFTEMKGENFTMLAKLPQDITIRSIKSDSAFSRAVIRLGNSGACTKCHDPANKILGYIVVDYSMKTPESTIAFTRKFSLIFTLIMVTIILAFVFFLHYKLVRKSLLNFQQAINQINEGNLDERIKIPKTTELGKLSASFNEMVNRFQQTQTELKRYHDQELKNSRKLATVGEMSARLAHEIRNPITGIANAVEIIMEEDNNEGNRQILAEIRRQAHRVNKAVSNMLNFARSKELNLRMSDLNEIIRSVVFFLQNQSAHHKVQFNTDLPADIPEFLFDPEQIENAMINIGLNAINACKINGMILFRTFRDETGNFIRIAVSDNGDGIPEDKLEEVFKPFYTTRTQGTGLGLAIVQEIIAMHGGSVSVSNNPTGGCTFVVSIPFLPG